MSENSKQYKPQAAQTAEKSNPSQKWYFAIVMVFAAMVLSSLQIGNISGKASGGPAMGCGGSHVAISKTSDKGSNISSSKQALTSILTPLDDTYIQKNNSGPYGDSSKLLVKNELKSYYEGLTGNSRMALLRFKVNAQQAYQSASIALKLDLDSQGADQQFKFAVWGLVLGTDCSSNNFKEDNLRYNDLAVVKNSNFGIDITHKCVFDGASGTGVKESLGTFTTTKGQEKKTITFSSTGLTRYVHTRAKYSKKTEVLLMFLISRVEYSSAVTKFASKEHSSLNPPRLDLTYQAKNDTLAAVGDTYVRFNGSGPYGNETRFLVKRSDKAYTRHGLLRFRVNTLETKKHGGVKLLLDVVQHKMSSASYHIWGLKTGAGCQLNLFEEASIKDNELGVSDTSPDGVKNSHGCLYQGNSGSLGKLYVKSSDVGKTVTFTSARFMKYAKEQANQSGSSSTDLVLLISRVESHSEPSYFATKEDTSKNPPRLQFSEVVVGEQKVCGDVCTNCPAKAFSATCSLGGEYTINGVKVRKLSITTMGKTFDMMGVWQDLSANGMKSFKTGQTYYLRTNVGDIPFAVLAGTSTTITCKPYLSIEGKLGDVTAIPGMDKFNMSSLNSPKFTVGVRLGQHMKESYPETPFAQCRPYFFVAVDTAIGVGDFTFNGVLGLNELNFLAAFDPNDPTAIVEFGSDALSAATGDTLSHFGLGYSKQGNLEWTSAVSLPVGVSETDFNKNLTGNIKGHVYGRAVVSIPTKIPLEVDAGIVYNLGTTNASKDQANELNRALFKGSLNHYPSNKIDNLKFGFNINSVALDFDIFSYKLGSGSYMVDNGVHRFAGFLAVPKGQSPQLIKNSSHAAHGFINKFFDKINGNAKAEIRGIIDSSQNSTLYRIKMTGEAKLVVGAKASAQAKLEVSNVKNGQKVDFYGKLDSSIKMEDLTSNVASGEIKVQGGLVVANNKATYDLSGSAKLTVKDLEVANVSVGVSNHDDPNGKVTLSGQIGGNDDKGPFQLSLSGSASSSSFSMSGTCSIKLSPIAKAFYNGPVKWVKEAEHGYKCHIERNAKCGWEKFWTGVSNVANCIGGVFTGDTRCAEYNYETILGNRVRTTCKRWECEKERPKECNKCTEIKHKTVSFGDVTVEFQATLKDDKDKPLQGTVTIKSGGKDVTSQSWDASTREVCLTIPETKINAKLSDEFPDLSFTAIEKTKFCTKVF